jgi:phosphocarrier protein HPr
MPASSEQAVKLDGDLHARPAGALAVAAARFSASVSLSVGGRRADAKSVLAVMGLGATSGQLVTVSAEGVDAGEAVVAVAAILGRATGVGT